MDIKKQFREKPLATIGTLVGIIGGVISIIVFSGNAYDKLGTYVVTDAELQTTLKGAETRIITQIQQEAAITREAIVGELQVRKSELEAELEDATSAGEIARILEHIKVLNKRMNRIKGVDQ